MNREHLYKAKRKGSNKEWIEGYYSKIDGRHYILTAYAADRGLIDFIEVKPDTVCEYTGLQDKDGRKIFEGDITKLVILNKEVRYFKVSFKKVIRKVLCHPDFDDDVEKVEKVELNAVCFEWYNYELFPCINENGESDVSKMKIIGNIFDYPELLKGEDGDE